MTLKDWLTIFGPPLTWLIAIAGWFFISRDHNKRECRKELRALLNELRDLAHRVEANACSYYSLGADQEAQRLAMLIRRDIGYLGGLVANLKQVKQVSKDFSLDGPLLGLRQAITGVDFDSAARTAKAHSDRVFADIAAATLAFTQAIEAMFLKTYPR